MTLAAVVEPAEIEIDAGGTGEVRVRIRNRGTRVDGFRVSVEGPFSAWAAVEPAEVQLFPKTEGEATITFSPPRAPEPAAGSHTFKVSIQSVSEPDSFTVEEGRLTIRPFVAFEAELPTRVERRWRRGTHAVRIRNTGNDAAHVSIKATDPEERLVLAVEPTEVDVGAAGTGMATVRSATKGWLVVGPAQRLPFSVDVTERSGVRQTVNALFEQRALVPRWAIPIAGAILAVMVAIAVGASIINPKQTDAPTAATSPSTMPSTPSPGPTDTVAPPTPTAQPTPTAAITDIRISGDPRVDGTHVASFARAYRDGSALKIEITYAINGDTCVLRIVMRGDVSSRILDIIEQASGDFSCARNGISVDLRDGTIQLTRPDPNGSNDTVSAIISADAFSSPVLGPHLVLRGSIGTLVVARS